ncbi:kinase-like domain-containing protein [Bombardia bombarda]|uniref:Kinase-like domain-containing protein n=1 Tax=Bombardia bombarda TaxID=252184 RepID=A0AA39XM22_9PEZI|nr:kinase-like domain-containing protein [Bombardia bombarda]
MVETNQEPQRLQTFLSIPLSCIIPILIQEVIQKGNDYEASLYKIAIDPAYNKLTKEGGNSVQDTFVLKVQCSLNQHKNELDAYTYFQNCPDKNIVQYYGSFCQKRHFCLLLEYIDGGNLENYFSSIDPPKSAEDQHLFLTSFFGAYRGLHRIHQASRAVGHVRGIHGDIKPDNLLLVKGTSGNIYDFTLKFADFGHSHFCHVRTDDQQQPNLDRHGNQTYSAPEAIHHTRFLEAGPNWINYAADIFSMGAITSEAIVWMVYGGKGLTQYSDNRRRLISSLPSFKGSGCDA